MSNFWTWLDNLTWMETYGVMLAIIMLALAGLGVADALVKWWQE